MSVSKFDDWFDHYMKEPWGYEFEMYRHAELCTYVVNGTYNPKEPVKPSDFYPNHDSESEQEKSESDIEAILRNRFTQDG